MLRKTRKWTLASSWGAAPHGWMAKNQIKNIWGLHENIVDVAFIGYQGLHCDGHEDRDLSVVRQRHWRQVNVLSQELAYLLIEHSSWVLSFQKSKRRWQSKQTKNKVVQDEGKNWIVVPEIIDRNILHIFHHFCAKLTNSISFITDDSTNVCHSFNIFSED